MNNRTAFAESPNERLHIKYNICVIELPDQNYSGDDRVQIVGPFADNPNLLFGIYSPFTDIKFVKTPLAGLKNLSDDTRHAAGCTDPACKQYSHDDIKQAVVGANFVIVCLGLGLCALNHLLL